MGCATTPESDVIPASPQRRPTDLGQRDARKAANECADAGLPKALSRRAAGPQIAGVGGEPENHDKATEQDSTHGRIAGDQFPGEPSWISGTTRATRNLGVISQ